MSGLFENLHVSVEAMGALPDIFGFKARDLIAAWLVLCHRVI